MPTAVDVRFASAWTNGIGEIAVDAGGPGVTMDTRQEAGRPGRDQANEIPIVKPPPGHDPAYGAKHLRKYIHTMNQHGYKAGTKMEQLGRAFFGGLIVAAVACHMVRAEGSETSRLAEVNKPQETGTSDENASPLRFVSIEPTVFFIKQKNALLQVVEIVVENTSEPVEAGLDVKLGSEERSTALGNVKKGKVSFQVHVPDISEPTPVEFVLKANGKVRDRRKMTWQPRRHWEVCMVPICHHDLGFTHPPEQVLHKYEGFYDDVLRFCEETNDWPEESKFRYTVEGTWSIQHFIENRPKEVIEKLAKYIKEGRIEILALFGNEVSAQCSHEGLIRLMYPSFRLKRQLGAPIRTGSITDVCGFSWGLPTVLAGADVKYFFAGLPTYFSPGFGDQSTVLRHGRPDAFRWEGPDGASVLVYYQGGYGCWFWGTFPRSYEHTLAKLPDVLSSIEEKCPFSVARCACAGCGDNLPPNFRPSRVAREWNGRWAYPKLIVATQSMFFERLERQCRDVRTFRGELPDTDFVVGALSTVKETSINRITYERLHSAEKFATVASLVGKWTYPAQVIRKAYDNALLYNEHTWGMAYAVGKLEDWSRSNKSHFAYKAAGLTESVLHSNGRGDIGSLDEIAGQIKLDEEGQHIVVFNPLSFQRTDVARLPCVRISWVGGPGFPPEKPFDLIDEDSGEKVSCQVVKLDSPRAPVPYAAHRYALGQHNPPELLDLVFVARDVPSLGWKTYRIVPKEKAVPFSSAVLVGKNTLESRFFKVALNPQTGVIESIYDKELSREIVDKDAPHKVNQLVARWAKSGKQESPGKATIQKGQSGPVYGSLIVSTEGIGCPQITQEIILYDNIKRIDLANRVLKDSTPLMEIYFAFPFKIDNPSFRFEGSCSVIKPLRDQFPGSNSNYYAVQHWADVSDGQIGVTLSPVESHLLEFGGLWPCHVSQIQHGVTPPDFKRQFVKADELTKGYMYSFVMNSNYSTNCPPTQQGDLLFRYSITTHTGDWKAGRPRDFGWAVGNPLTSLSVKGKKEGTLGKKTSFCQVDKPNVMLLTLKRAEDGDGVILRLIETEGNAVTATVTLPHLTIKKVHRTNLVEENQGELTFTPHEVTVPVNAFGITTIRLQMH